MFSDRVFQVALLISLAVHGILFTKIPNLAIHAPSVQKKSPEVKISYVQNPVKPQEEAKPVKAEPFLKLPPKITVNKQIPPPFIDRENLFKVDQSIKPRKQFIDKPTVTKADILAIKKKITLPPIDLNKISNPLYVSYYQIVREKIKRAAYQNYTGQDVGEVTVSFIVADDGSLRDLRLMEGKSSPSEYLREIALASVKDASPFPGFPKELDYPQLSFNLAVTFEVE